MRALEFLTGHVIYNPAYTYKFQLKTTYNLVNSLALDKILSKLTNVQCGRHKHCSGTLTPCQQFLQGSMI